MNPDLHPAEAAQRQRAWIVRFVRSAFFILTVTFTLLWVLRPPEESSALTGMRPVPRQGVNENPPTPVDTTQTPLQTGSQPAPETAPATRFMPYVPATQPQHEIARLLALNWWLVLSFALIVFAIALLVDLMTPRKKISTIGGVVIGVLAGMLATWALGFVIDLVVEGWIPNKDELNALAPTVNQLKILLGITLCYLGVTTVLQTQDDFRLVIPYIEFVKQFRGVRPLLIDSSVLIDGRIADVATTGFLQAPVIIPRFVVHELQVLADSADTMTRAKGRRGLDVIARMQRAPRLDVTIDETPVPGKAVDQMLVELARSMPAVVVTSDTGLARVAAIQNVLVLNINDLSNALKSALLAGESLMLKIMRAGEQPGQGVGYLADGTMVVVEDGGGHIGETAEMVVTSSLQTSAGRLIFARLAEPDAPTVEPMAALPDPEPAAEMQPATVAALAESARPRSPFPPKPPASLRSGTPRNPRR